MKIMTRLGFGILLSFMLNAYTHATPATGQSLDGIVAVVNDTPITQTELDESIDSVKKQIQGSNMPTPPYAVLKKQILQQLIDRKIQLQLAEQSGIKVDDAQVDKAVASVAKQNNLTVAQLLEQVRRQGLSVDAYHKELREEILMQQLQQQQVASKIVITPQEVNDFIRSKAWQSSNNKEYHLEDILVALPDSPSSQQVQDARKHAMQVLEKVRHGASFQSIAMAESSGNKALQGGDLGWRKLPEVPSAFADSILSLKKDGIAGPLQTPNGFHIIHLVDVRNIAAHSSPNNKQIEQFIYQRKMEEASQVWMAKIRSQAFINMNPAN